MPHPLAPTFYGDADPAYAGSVVKALASAKHGYAAITAAVADLPPAPPVSPWGTCRVVDNLTLSPFLTQLVVYAPLGAAQVQPGQIFRLQPYASATPVVMAEDNAPLRFPPEGVAAAAYSADAQAGTLTFMLWPQGISTRILAGLTPGTPLVVLGPVGCPTRLTPGEVALWVGHSPTAPALWQDHAQQMGATLAVLNTHNGGLEAYVAGATPLPSPDQVNKVLLVGHTPEMLKAWSRLWGEHRQLFRPDTDWVMAVTSPMHCLMQGVCGQCLQRHTPTASAEETYVFSCTTPWQEAPTLDGAFMTQRLGVNRVQEKIFGALLNIARTPTQPHS